MGEPFKFSSKISDTTKDTNTNTSYTPSTKATAIENSSPKIVDYNKPSFSSSVSHGTKSRFNNQDSSSSLSTNRGATISSSSQYKDFYNQIQVTKDRYKTDFEKAMNFDKTASKPPIIKEKLPRPDLTPS